MYPTLYKKAATGKIHMWRIWVEGNTIHSESGSVDGKKTYQKDIIFAGKNLGRSNETTPEQQAELEAKAKWEQKLKKGHVLTVGEAQLGEVDEGFVSGGFFPMLAHSFQDHEQKVAYPCYVQPKLDGFRAVYKDGKLYSRTRIPYTTCEHLEEFLARYKDRLMVDGLDGELYSHALCDDFERLSSAIRSEKTPKEDRLMIEFHVYDINLPGATYEERRAALFDIQLLMLSENEAAKMPIRFLPDFIANEKTDVVALTNTFIRDGFEGGILRNKSGLYESGKRSKNLLKVKFFQDGEFRVVGMKEGRGKLVGHVGAFVCEIADHFGVRTFDAKAEGPYEQLRAYFQDPSLWQGKLLTVRFISYTRKNRVPKHGVGVRFRDPNY